MPQFDLATFLPQIFWLLTCFGIFYYFVSTIIIPRISSTLEKREEKISLDKISAGTLQAQIDELNSLSKNLREKSSLSYHKSIEDALKECSIQREKSLNKAKEDIDNLTHDSEQKIANFISKSRTEYNSASSLIADTIVKKLFGKNSEFKEAIKVPINKSDN